MKIHLQIKDFMKRIFILIVILVICAGSIYFSLRSLSKTISVMSQNNSENSVKTIILDAGHGGMDGGCTSVNGVDEKGINLSIALTLRDILSANGFEVILTRDSDKSIYDEGIEGIAEQKLSDMENRLEILNSKENAICISIHQNQYTDSQYSGAQIFYSAHLKSNSELAETFQNTFRELLQPENNREIKECGDSLYLCCNSENPMVMVECGFLSNPNEATLLESEEYQKKVAFTIFSAICRYLS